MAIQIEDYVNKCAEKIEQKSMQAAKVGAVRTPERPIVITYLDRHPAEGQKKFEMLLKTGWPTSFHRIASRMKQYQTPEEFKTAIEREDEEGTTEIDRMILNASNDPGLRTSNLLMVYFVNFNSEYALDYIHLLDRPYSTPMGGYKERIIFAIGKTTTNKALKQAKAFVDAVKTVAANADSPAYNLWSKTTCVVLSDYKYGGMTLTNQEYIDNYALALDILLVGCSVRIDGDSFSPTLLPRVTAPYNAFVTATLHRESKPSEQIARAVLHAYFKNGVNLATATVSRDTTNVALKEQAINAIKNLYKQIYESGLFPKDSAMVHFPGGAVNGVDVGLTGGADKSVGTWAAFCDKYFVSPVAKAYEDRTWLKDYFARYFSKVCGYSCGAIQQYFPAFKTELDDTRVEQFLRITEPQPSASLREIGLYEARATLGALCYEALKDSVSELSLSAGNYAQILSALQGQVMPSDDSVRSYYENIVNGHMGVKIGDDTLEELLKRPCEEHELEMRIDSYIESITSLSSLRKNFFEELKDRLADDGANMMISNFLNMPDHALINDARLHVGVLSPVCEALMFDPALLGVSCDKLFKLCGTNRMDHIVLYEFDASVILSEVAG